MESYLINDWEKQQVWNLLKIDIAIAWINHLKRTNLKFHSTPNNSSRT